MGSQIKTEKRVDGEEEGRRTRVREFLMGVRTGLLAILALVLGVSLVMLSRKGLTKGSTTAPGESMATNAVRGQPNDLWADIVLGQIDFNQATPNEKVPYKLFNPGGVLVDRSVVPNRVYVWDSVNSRILGHRYLGKCQRNAQLECTANSDCVGQGICQYVLSKSADIVIGQPSGYGYSGCNGDGNMENYPNRKDASATSLCGIPGVQISLLEGGAAVTMDVDDQGNLYVPDFYNSRVLKFNRPFETDQAADEVWGQDSIAGNRCNKTDADISVSGPPPATDASLCMGRNGQYQESFNAGVDIDAGGNLWVADSSNHRVVRFSHQADGSISKTADLVLGQPDFNSRLPGSGLNQLNGPSSVYVNPVNGKVYVADYGNGRVGVYEPPFTSGMSFAFLFTGSFWSPTSVVPDPSGIGLWVSDWGNGMLTLWDWEGLSPHKVLFKDTFQANGTCGSTTNSPSCINPAPNGECWDNICGAVGGVGFDRDNNLYVTGTGPVQDVWRFPAPIPTPRAGYVYSADKKIFSPPEGFNLGSAGGLMSPRGIVVQNDQLIVSDGYKIVFWNGIGSLVNGRPADGVVGVATFGDIDPWTIGKIKADGQNHLWVIRKGTVDVYQLPLTNNEEPLVRGAISFEEPIPALGGGQVTWEFHDDFWDVEPDPSGDYLWLSQGIETPALHRVFRIRNPLTDPVVDVVLGQPDLVSRGCNRYDGTDYGQAYQLAAPNTVCFPGSVKLDKLGNLWVSDHSLEFRGNNRLLMFDRGLFTGISGSPLFGVDATLVSHKIKAWEPAFDSENRMVVGFNPWVTDEGYFPGVYSDPVAKLQTSAEPDRKLRDFFSQGYFSVFDENDNLYVADLNRGRVLVYFTPTHEMSVTPTPGVITATPTPGENNLPEIVSGAFPRGKVGQLFRKVVSGTDSDTADVLGMTVDLLPPGLSLGDCSTTVRDGVRGIACEIAGIPIEAGTYFPEISLFDNRGGSVSAEFTMVVGR